MRNLERIKRAQSRMFLRSNLFSINYFSFSNFSVISKLTVYTPDDPHVPWNDAWFTEEKMDKTHIIDFFRHEHAELFSVRGKLKLKYNFF